jgi:hypothetical protein
MIFKYSTKYRAFKGLSDNNSKPICQVCVSSLFLGVTIELRPRMVLIRPRTYKILLPKKNSKIKETFLEHYQIVLLTSLYEK